MEKKRKLKNFLIIPGFQLKVGLYFVASSVAAFGVLLAILYINFEKIRKLVANSHGVDYAALTEINTILYSIVNYSVLLFVALIIFTIIYSIVVTHRIAGPTVAICSYLDEMIGGNLKPNRNLRPYDELQPIMEKLNQLSEKLDKN